MEFKTKPKKHQLEFLKQNAHKSYIGLAWEMGTGKTKEAIDWMRYKYYQNKRVLRTLIVVPPIALLNWRDEWDKHSSSVAYVTVLNQKSSKQRIKALNKGLADGRCIVVANYDGLKGLFKALEPIDWEIVVADESHKIKNPDAVMTECLLKIAHGSKHRIALSGTPMPNGPIDIFTQSYFLDNGATFGPSFTSFRAKYFYNALEKADVKFKRWVPYKSSYPELNRKINTLWHRVLKSECLDLPPKHYITMKLEMLPEQRKMTTELVKHSISRIKDGAVVANSAGTELIRLRQVSSGFYVMDETNEKVRFKRNPKIDATKAIVSSVDGKVIVWACFRDNIFQLLDELKDFNPASIFGDTKDKYAEEKRFNNDPNCKVIICNPQSASTAINLVSANTVVYFSQSHDFEHRSQGEDRSHRMGSEIHERITYYDLEYEKSVDPVIKKALQSKQDMSNLLLGPGGIEMLEAML